MILTAKSISGIFLVIWRQPQGRKGNFRVKYILAYVTLLALQVFKVSFEI